MNFWLSMAVFLVPLWLGFSALTAWGRHLREKKILELRAMLHRERLASLEKGQAPPEADVEWDTITAFFQTLTPSVEEHLRLVAAVTGILGWLLIALGLGVCITFGLGADLMGERDLWKLGLIPAFAGAGLLVGLRWIGGSGKGG